MGVQGYLSLIVCVVAMSIYLALNGFKRAAWAWIALIAFGCGLLAFLIHSGMNQIGAGVLHH